MQTVVATPPFDGFQRVRSETEARRCLYLRSRAAQLCSTCKIAAYRRSIGDSHLFTRQTLKDTPGAQAWVPRTTRFGLWANHSRTGNACANKRAARQ